MGKKRAREDLVNALRAASSDEDVDRVMAPIGDALAARMCPHIDDALREADMGKEYLLADDWTEGGITAQVIISVSPPDMVVHVNSTIAWFAQFLSDFYGHLGYEVLPRESLPGQSILIDIDYDVKPKITPRDDGTVTRANSVLIRRAPH